MTLPRNRKTGYFAAIMGSLIGAVLLLNIGGYLGMSYVENFMPNAELDDVIPALVGQFIGWWTGEILGCWLSLQWQNHQDAKKTVICLAILTPLGITIWAVSYLFLFNWASDHWSSVQVDRLHNQLRPISVIFTIIVLAFLARFRTKPKSKNGYF